MKHLASAAVDPEVRLYARFRRTAQLLTVGLLGGLAFLMGHAPEEPAAPPGNAEAFSRAWLLAESAQGLAEARRPAEALSNWQSAYELAPDPILLLEIAQLEHDAGHDARAAHALERFLVLGEGRVSLSRRQLVARQLQAATAATARLLVQTNVLGANVELDAERGVAVGSGFVVNLVLDPGEQRLGFSKPGFETQTLLLDLAPGEVRSLRIDLDKAAAGRSESGSTKPRWTLSDPATPGHVALPG